MSDDQKKFDLIVVGGGIYGLMLALEGSLHGLKVLLLERHGWGTGTTAAWLRILHGGLRYLQSMDLPRFHESVRERRWFLRLFPDLVSPLPCIMPLYETGSHSPLLMKAALVTNDLLSMRRNRGVAESCRLPASRILSAIEVEKALPFVEKAGLEAGALWYDAIAVESGRLLLEILHWAESLGCQAIERTEVVDVLHQAGAVYGVLAVGQAGGTRQFEAPVVVNMTGHWSIEFARRSGFDLVQSRAQSWAWNVLFDVPYEMPSAAAITARRPGAQTFFVVPRHGKALVGTGHAPVQNEDDSTAVPQEHIDLFIEQVSEAAPGLGLSSSNVTEILQGRLPAISADPHRLSPRPLIVDHEDWGCRGLFTVWGIKFTTSRAVARRVLKRAFGSRLAVGVRYVRPPKTTHAAG